MTLKYTLLQRIGLVDFHQVDQAIEIILDTVLQQPPEPRRETAERLVDLAALSIAEIEMLFKSPSLTTQPAQLPFVVAPATLRVGILKTDTLPTWRCEAADRLEQQTGLPSDAFLFDGDSQKFGAAFAPNLGGLSVLVNDYAYEIEQAVASMAGTHLGRRTDINAAMQFIYCTALIWKLRAGVFTAAEDDAALAELGELIRRWGLPLQP